LQPSLQVSLQEQVHSVHWQSAQQHVLAAGSCACAHERPHDKSVSDRSAINAVVSPITNMKADSKAIFLNMVLSFRFFVDEQLCIVIKKTEPPFYRAQQRKQQI
jgi:hypothetical protein